MNNNKKDQYLIQQQSMLLGLQQLEFAAVDLALYLDTHPNDPVALYRHKQVTSHLKQFKEAYEAQFGPMCILNTEIGDTWRYINGPWPWDSKYDMSNL